VNLKKKKKFADEEVKMREAVSLLPGGEEEFEWFRSRLIPRRPDVFDDDYIDFTREDSPISTTLVENTTVQSDDSDDVIARPPLSDLERLYGEYERSVVRYEVRM
jgi:hypothetical protein